MAEFQKIENDEQLEAWLKTQDLQMIRMIAARASLRRLPAAMAEVDQKVGAIDGKDFVLACLRANLLSWVAITCHTPDMSSVENTARSAAKSLLNVAYSATAAAHSAAFFAANSASLSSIRSADAVASSVHSVDSAAYSAANYADYKDAESGQTDGYLAVFSQSLWPYVTPVQSLLSEWETFAGLPDPDGLWAFWRDWYAGMLQGTPMDWDLQLQVALIEPEVWDAGPQAVAEEIARIEAEFAKRFSDQEPRQEAFEPRSLERLLANKVIGSIQCQKLSVDISDAFERFYSQTGANQVPETFLPLQSVPKSLLRISAVLRHDVHTPESEQKLREEIGRLNAKVSLLETELAKAQTANPTVFSKAFLRQAASSLGDWKLYAALCGGLWFVSGDEFGMQQRLENIIALRDAIFGDENPVPAPETMLPDNPVREV
ncbi:hypothetical protein [Puniceibacterium sediminis]|uniref:Uncharacterized protein n=1 Tax=Puniceibacterium sediminis TaxID=1608407 RepID=A0A238XVP1_9RHOB|nr:hypothetical protein [Puniceibacterium sediminis]SNR63065.1 hypothetical protein SAMN06265370_11370 [Puniceibacterium sediminis]